MSRAPDNRQRGRGAGDRRGPRDSRPRDQQPRDKKLREKDVDVAREAARDVLRAVREQSAYANLLLPRLLRERRITGRDAAFATELTYGAARAQGLLDAVISSAANRGVDDIDGNVLDILRLGTYQLLRTRTSPHAAVSTSVDLARAELGMGPSGFVNAVLRKISQRDEELWIDELAPSMADDMIGNLAFRYAHPRWIAGVFFDALGRSAGQLQAALAADDQRPPVHLVARPGMITAEELALTRVATRAGSRPTACTSQVVIPARSRRYETVSPVCRTKAANWSPARSPSPTWVRTAAAGSTCVPDPAARPR